jgi:hypothetical protein
MKKNRAAARARIATPAMAMPTIAPVERPCFESGARVALDEVDEVGAVEGVVELELDVDEGVADGNARALGVPSAGKESPG